MHFYESVLIDTKEGMQCKTYASVHPEGFVIVKPKYIPTELLESESLKKRFIFSKCMTRFNLFTKKEDAIENLKKFKKAFPNYIIEDKNHSTWFFAVPKEKIKKIHDAKQGLRELLKVPYNDLDDYLKAAVGLIKLITQSGVKIEDMGIMHSTLLGNYTPGKSDIDVLIFGKGNGWKTIKFLETAKHPKLKWKTEQDWGRYFKERVVSTVYSEEEYVYNMARKRDDGFFNNHVFSIFCVENPDELWYDWDEKHEPIGTAKITAKISDDYNSIVRPGYYEIEDSKIIEGAEVNKPIKRIVTWSRPFVLQAKKGETVEACGLLEKVRKGNGEEQYQLVIGYMDAYITDRGEKEYLKVLIGDK